MKLSNIISILTLLLLGVLIFYIYSKDRISKERIIKVHDTVYTIPTKTYNDTTPILATESAPPIPDRVSGKYIITQLEISCYFSHFANSFLDYLSKEESVNYSCRSNVIISVTNGTGELRILDVKDKFSFFIESCTFQDNTYYMTLINPKSNRVKAQLTMLDGQAYSFELNNDPKSSLILFNK